MNQKNFWREEKLFREICNIYKDSITEVVKRIVEHPARIIGFSISDPRQLMSLTIIRSIKKRTPQKVIIVGGPYYNDVHKTNEEKKIIDYFVHGEGESAIQNILKKPKKNVQIPGTLYYTKDILGRYNEVLSPGIKKQVDLKEYSYPRYKHFNLKEYKTNSVTSEWSRGCIAKCTFCQNIVHFKNYKFRTAKNIADELEYNSKINGVKHFSLVDPAINGNIKLLEKICDLIIERNLDINWSGSAIPRKEMTLSLLKKMKKAGCIRLEYGVESGSDKVLKIMNKIHRAKEAELVLKHTKIAEIKVVIFIIVGYPGESEEDFNMTLDFLKENKENIDLVRSVNSPYLQTGTDLMENKDKYGIIIPKNKGDYTWYTKEGNTVKIREKRAKQVINLLDKLSIPHDLNTLSETKDLEIVNTQEATKLKIS